MAMAYANVWIAEPNMMTMGIGSMGWSCPVRRIWRKVGTGEKAITLARTTPMIGKTVSRTNCVVSGDMTAMVGGAIC